ncbi:hypothetical protein DESC_960008 [Desulfosarcina cetonica]|nr:hypothetical protein DESC_960008 [Desulfosarcina cetonica]
MFLHRHGTPSHPLYAVIGDDGRGDYFFGWVENVDRIVNVDNPPCLSDGYNQCGGLKAMVGSVGLTAF